MNPSEDTTAYVPPTAEPTDENQMDSVLSRTQTQAQQTMSQAGQLAGQVKDQAGDLLQQAQDHAGQLKDQAGQMVAQAQDQAGQIAGQVKDQASQLAQDLRQQLSVFLEAQKGHAAHALADIAQAAHQIATQLRADNQAMLANAIDGIATRLQSFADNLQQKTLDELLHDIEQGAQVQTVLLIAGGIILGLIATRAVRSSRQS